MLPVQLALTKLNAPRTKRFEAIIDSGASRCLFHGDIGKFLGLDLKSGQPEVSVGISGQEVVWLHEVMLYVPGGPVKIRAGFKEQLPCAGLLGMNGFFEHFHVHFDTAALVCTLERIKPQP